MSRLGAAVGLVLSLVACLPRGASEPLPLTTLDVDDPNEVMSGPGSGQGLHILWVSSYGPEDSWSLQIRTGIWEALARRGYSAAQGTLDWEAVNLGFALTGPETAAQVDEAVSALQSSDPDVVILSDDEAIRAVLPLLPPVGVNGVACGLNTPLGDPIGSQLLERDHFAVVVEPVRPVQTVALAREFTGSSGPYLLIGDASPSGELVTETAYETLVRLGMGDGIRYVVADTWVGWKDSIVQEGPTAEFVLVTAYQPLPDENGEPVSSRGMMAWMLENLDVPVFSLVNGVVIDGAVGGLVADGYEQGRLAGELAVTVAQDRPEVPRTGPSKLVINAAAARHWGLEIPALFPIAAEVYRSLPTLPSQSGAAPADLDDTLARVGPGSTGLPWQTIAGSAGLEHLSGGVP